METGNHAGRRKKMKPVVARSPPSREDGSKRETVIQTMSSSRLPGKPGAPSRELSAKRPRPPVAAFLSRWKAPRPAYGARAPAFSFSRNESGLSLWRIRRPLRTSAICKRLPLCILSLLMRNRFFQSLQVGTLARSQEIQDSVNVRRSLLFSAARCFPHSKREP